MSWRDAPLYVETHDITRWLLERTAGWQENVTLGPRIDHVACELLEAVALALTFPARRADQLEAADFALTRLRCLLRLAHDTGRLSAGGLRFALGRLQAAGRMLGGWRKRVQSTALGRVGRKEKISGDGPQAAGV